MSKRSYTLQYRAPSVANYNMHKLTAKLEEGCEMIRQHKRDHTFHKKNKLKMYVGIVLLFLGN